MIDSALEEAILQMLMQHMAIPYACNFLGLYKQHRRSVQSGCLWPLIIATLFN